MSTLAEARLEQSTLNGRNLKYGIGGAGKVFDQTSFEQQKHP